MALRIPLYQSINQSINLFVQKCNRHWTWHQGRMQPPLTGAGKNNISKSYKWQWQYIREKIELTEKCSDPTFIIKLDNRRLKLEILVANTTLPGSLFQKFMTRLWNILASRIFSIWFFCSSWLFPLVCKMQKSQLMSFIQTMPKLVDIGSNQWLSMYVQASFIVCFSCTPVLGSFSRR